MEARPGPSSHGQPKAEPGDPSRLAPSPTSAWVPRIALAGDRGMTTRWIACSSPPKPHDRCADSQRNRQAHQGEQQQKDQNETVSVMREDDRADRQQYGDCQRREHDRHPRPARVHVVDAHGHHRGETDNDGEKPRHKRQFIGPEQHEPAWPDPRSHATSRCCRSSRAADVFGYNSPNCSSSPGLSRGPIAPLLGWREQAAQRGLSQGLAPAEPWIPGTSPGMTSEGMGYPRARRAFPSLDG